MALAVPMRPAAVVAVRTAEDVVGTVRFARQHGLTAGVQATGHGAESSYAGHLLIVTRGPTRSPCAASVVHRRWRDKAGRALQVAADILDAGLDVFDERLPGHDERVESLARVIEAAARSTSKAKVIALGRVLADRLREDGDTDEALQLAAIEGPHVAVLAHWSSPGPP